MHELIHTEDLHKSDHHLQQLYNHDCQASNNSSSMMKVVNFLPYEVYHHLWHGSFKKPVDALVLFAHWVLTNHGYALTIASPSSGDDDHHHKHEVCLDS